MRTRSCVWVWLFVFAAICSASQGGADKSSSTDAYLGKWTGTWDGAGTGGFELTLEKNDAGVLGGRVSVTGDPAYQAVLKTVSFEGKKMSAKYDFTPDDRAEVVLDASFDGNQASGSWSLREKGSANELACGSWTVSKK